MHLICKISSILLLIGLLSHFTYDTATYDKALDINWGITLLKDCGCDLVYDKDSGVSYNGDGFRYHVFKYADEDLIASRLAWAGEDQILSRSDRAGEGRAPLFADTLSGTCQWILDELHVPENKRPDYENCLYYYDNQDDYSEIILLRDPERKRLYICESFF